MKHGAELSFYRSGDLEALVVSDGHFVLPTGFLVTPEAPLAEREAVLKAAGQGGEQIQLVNNVTVIHLGYAYALSGRLPEGVILMEEALDEPEATGTAHHPLLLAYLGEARLLAGRRDDAVAVARRALDLAHRQKERGNEAWVLRLLGEIGTQADPSALESAAEYYGRALARADELGMRPLVAHCHLGLGKLYHRNGDGATAQEHLTTAATMYREMDMGFWLEKVEVELQTQ